MQTVPISSLEFDSKNANRGTKRGSEVIEESIRELGAGRSVLCDKDLRLIGGNKSVQAAIAVGLENAIVVPVTGDQLVVVQRTDLSLDDAKGRKLAIADNRASDLSLEWDADVLLELSKEIDLDPFFTAAELDALMPSVAELNGDEDETPEEPEGEPSAKPGDLYILGRHRLLCGDCRDFETVATLMAGQKLNIAVTSPPYASQRKYDESSGFKPIHPDEYVAWYRDVAANVMAHLSDDGSYFLNIKEHCDDGQRSLYVKDLTVAHVREWGWMLVDEFCWRNTRNGVPGGWPNRFKNAWEPVFHFCRSAGIKFRPDAVSSESDGVFEYSPNNGKAKSGSGLLGLHAGGYQSGMARPSNVIEASAESGVGAHSAPFPVALPLFFINAFSDRGDIIFDPFMGSGTTLIAAEKSGRVAYGTEISPAYCDVIVARWEKLTGKKAELRKLGL